MQEQNEDLASGPALVEDWRKQRWVEGEVPLRCAQIPRELQGWHHRSEVSQVEQSGLGSFCCREQSLGAICP